MQLSLLRPSFSPLTREYITPPSSCARILLLHKHHVLPSHHHHRPTSTSTSTSTTASTVSIGTAYEHLCARTLRRLGFALTHTGGRADRGIDLLGTWTLPAASPASPANAVSAESAAKPAHESTTPPGSPSPPHTQTQTLRVIVQCKAHTRTPHPSWARELEGAAAAAGRHGAETIGVLCATRAATAGLREAVRLAGRGMVWVRIEDGGEDVEGEGQGRVTQLLWNEAVARAVGRNLATGLRYVKGSTGDRGGRGRRVGLREEIVLMVDGRVWEPDCDGGGEGEGEGEKEGESRVSDTI